MNYLFANNNNKQQIEIEIIHDKGIYLQLLEEEEEKNQELDPQLIKLSIEY